LKAIPSQDGDVQKHILPTIVGDDEAVTFANIKPLNRSGYLKNIDRRTIGDVLKRPDVGCGHFCPHVLGLTLLCRQTLGSAVIRCGSHFSTTILC